MKEAASILLQTIPDSIDIEEFQKEIIKKFPEIESIHDLHIWQLTQQKFVSTAHIIFLNPPVYKTIINDVLAFFHEQGINIVTIQPEFKSLRCDNDSPTEEMTEKAARDSCLVACKQACEEKLCCRKGSDESSVDSQESKSKSDARLEQVISVMNISAEELNAISNYTSARSLNSEETELTETTDGPKKRSSTSLYNPTSNVRHKHKFQKTVSSTDSDNNQIPGVSESEGIHLVGIKRFVSESVIKTGEKDGVRRQNSEILVENRMLKQLNTTDNNEMEDLFDKCDKETL